MGIIPQLLEHKILYRIVFCLSQSNHGQSVEGCADTVGQKINVNDLDTVRARV